MRDGTVVRYCLCGGSYSGWSHPRSAAEDIAAAFDWVHRGEGHGSATPEEAAAARERQSVLERSEWELAVANRAALRASPDA